MKGKQTQLFVKDNRLIKLHTLNAFHRFDHFMYIDIELKIKYFYTMQVNCKGTSESFAFGDTELNNICRLIYHRSIWCKMARDI